jgi:hypothetical protein
MVSTKTLLCVTELTLQTYPMTVKLPKSFWVVNSTFPPIVHMYVTRNRRELSTESPQGVCVILPLSRAYGARLV